MKRKIIILFIGLMLISLVGAGILSNVFQPPIKEDKEMDCELPQEILDCLSRNKVTDYYWEGNFSYSEDGNIGQDSFHYVIDENDISIRRTLYNHYWKDSSYCSVWNVEEVCYIDMEGKDFCYDRETDCLEWSNIDEGIYIESKQCVQTKKVFGDLCKKLEPQDFTDVDIGKKGKEKK